MDAFEYRLLKEIKANEKSVAKLRKDIRDLERERRDASSEYERLGEAYGSIHSLEYALGIYRKHKEIEIGSTVDTFFELEESVMHKIGKIKGVVKKILYSHNNKPIMYEIDWGDSVRGSFYKDELDKVEYGTP